MAPDAETAKVALVELVILPCAGPEVIWRFEEPCVSIIQLRVGPAEIFPASSLASNVNVCLASPSLLYVTELAVPHAPHKPLRENLYCVALVADTVKVALVELVTLPSAGPEASWGCEELSVIVLS